MTGLSVQEKAPLLREKHIDYVSSLDKDPDALEYVMTEHLRMGGIYWGLSSLALLGAMPDASGSQGDDDNECQSSSTPQEKTGEISESPLSLGTFVMSKCELLRWISRCQGVSGGFGPSVDHDPHITSTHYAILIAVLCHGLDSLDCDKAAEFIASLQQPDGSFYGDNWGEADTRFVYCALSSLTILNQLHRIDVAKTVQYLQRCINFDGGFGWVPGGESHAASAFCCVAGLALANGLHIIDCDRLCWWLSERQTTSGGFNGRPEKAPDICYSWLVCNLHLVSCGSNRITLQSRTQYGFAVS
eukprot:GHVT01019429.1.p1 GENE.GHVT01019429.1~~GHVT01019429.1.p1  ORF type:complete len:302 (+),score=20.67 GHVT01019429.1:1791-2696(+)